MAHDVLSDSELSRDGIEFVQLERGEIATRHVASAPATLETEDAFDNVLRVSRLALDALSSIEEEREIVLAYACDS